jgi:hypothetical protein
MGAPLIEYLGWLATAVFAGSYLCKGSAALKRVQMVGALMWVVYGLLIKATPVVAANLLVVSVAGWTLARKAEPAAGSVHSARSTLQGSMRVARRDGR